MANGQARLAFSLRTTLALLRDVAEFARNPAPAPAQLDWGRAFVLAFVLLCLLDAGLTAGSIIVWWGAEAAGYQTPLMTDLEMSATEEWIGAVGVAPVLEEALFRGWLSGRRAALEFATRIALVIAILTFAVMLLEIGASPEAMRLVQMAALAYAIYALVIWLRERKFKHDIPAWFTEHYRYLVWASAIAFGTIHLLNYNELSGPLDLVMVLSQTLGGLVLAYTRTRLGLHAAIAQHALFNAVLTAADP